MAEQFVRIAPIGDDVRRISNISAGDYVEVEGHINGAPVAVRFYGPEESGPDPVMVMAGNPVEGFVLYGPAVPNTPEIEHLTDVVLRGDWWYVPITPMPVDPNA